MAVPNMVYFIALPLRGRGKSRGLAMELTYRIPEVHYKDFYCLPLTMPEAKKLQRLGMRLRMFWPAQGMRHWHDACVTQTGTHGQGNFMLNWDTLNAEY